MAFWYVHTSLCPGRIASTMWQEKLINICVLPGIEKTARHEVFSHLTVILLLRLEAVLKNLVFQNPYVHPSKRVGFIFRLEPARS
jgi:hypothetical protein